MKKLLIACLLVQPLLWVSLAFSQGLPLKDGNSSSLADIQACGAENCLRATGPTGQAGAGLQGITGSTGPGVSDATGGRMNRAYVSEGNALRTSTPVVLWDDTFTGTTQNTSKYTVNFATETITSSGGFLNLWAAGASAANIRSGIQTFRTFPILGKSETRVNISMQLSLAHQALNLVEFGLFSANLASNVAPTDGAFFRYNASNELRGVINFNGVETQTAAITQPSVAVTHDFTIVIQTNTVLFYIDNAVVGTINLLTDAPSQGQPFQQGALPLTIRTYTTATFPASIETVKVTDVFVNILGTDLGRSWSESKAGMGHMAYQGQNGSTMGTTANTLNAATPAAAALTNTAISTGSPVGLGGLAHVLPTLAAGTDGVLFSYQNPVGSVTQTPRTLVIRGVTLSGAVDVVLTGGPLVLAYSLAYGHTAISLATAETASFATATTKAPRRIWLGVQTCVVTAAAGTPLGPGPITVKFDSPVVVAPGEFIAITVRNQGTVTTTGSIVVAAAFDGYYE